MNLLNDKIDSHPRRPREGHRKQDVQYEPPPPQHDLHCAEVGDLRRWTGDHKRCGAAHAHAVHQPLVQQRYRPAAAHVQRHADGGRHQYAETLVLSEQAADKSARDVNLIQRRQQYAQCKTATKFPATWGRWP